MHISENYYRASLVSPMSTERSVNAWFYVIALSVDHPTLLSVSLTLIKLICCAIKVFVEYTQVDGECLSLL